MAMSVHRGRVSAAMEGNWKYRPVALTKQQLFRDLREVKWNLMPKDTAVTVALLLSKGLNDRRGKGS